MARPLASGTAEGTNRATADASRAPSVVAILPTRDPGPWFEETLAALAAQDYPALSVLVLVTGGGDDPTERVARWLPSAFVRRLGGDRTYAQAVDEALGMVEGAAFFLLCHDDCAPDPHAVHVMVEESYRSNAGVLTPKMVQWDDPSVLLHVGLHADRTGAVVERVSPGEIDHGQHDAVMDVFVAPGGFSLVRADLLRELGGYDTAIAAMGEDLDLCWRAHLAGARVVVVPDARVRHLEVLASGIRPVPPAIAPGAAGAAAPAGSQAGAGGQVGAPTLQELQRRHELRAVLKCYGWFHLVRVLPQAMLLAVGEWVQPGPAEEAMTESVRFRTVGDATCTGAVRSTAATVEDIIAEVAASRISERGATRADDRFSETAMEDRKREGYF